MHQAPVAEALQVSIADPVVGFVVATGGDVPAVLLEIVVNFAEPFSPVDDREEPGGPAQGFVLRSGSIYGGWPALSVGFFPSVFHA